MLLAALAIVAHPLAAYVAAQPIRVWLEPAGVVAPGARMHVYVDLARAGHLVALRFTTTGRIAVLFPQDPDEGTYLAAGTYELRGSGQTASFVAAEPEGTGLVLVALAPLPHRFDEFARGGDWDAAALAASWNGADGVSALLDVVQRMQGDGFFNYDFLDYTVAAHTAFARGATGGVCYGYGCGRGGVIVIAYPFAPPVPWHPRHRRCVQPLVWCTAKFGRFDRDCAEWCRAGFGCVAPERDRVLALYRRHAPLAQPARPERPATPRVIEPRPRLPVARPARAPVARGTYVRPAPRRTAGALVRRIAAAEPERPAAVLPRAREPAAAAPVGVARGRPAPLAPGSVGARAGTRPALIDWPRGVTATGPTASAIPSAPKTRTAVGFAPRQPREAKPGRAATWTAAPPRRAAATTVVRSSEKASGRSGRGKQ